MNKFKQVVNSNSTDKVADAINLIEGQWESVATINRKAQILDAKVRASVLGDSKILDTISSTYNGDTLKEIYAMHLPSYMSWDYWVAINQWVLYWVNRSEIESKDAKDIQAFKLALSLGRKFGTIGIMKQDDDYVIGTLIDKQYKGGELVKANMIPEYIANRYGYATPDAEYHLVKWSDKANKEKIAFNKDDGLIFACRENGIGDFVWCMKDILIDIYLKTMIQSNASNLQDKVIAEVNNPDTLPIELALMKNPFITYAVKIVDTQSGASANSFKFSESKGGEHSYINTLIETLKHHQEYYYAKYGRPISSNKAQALSSDSSLSISSAEAIARDWDDRVKELADEWKKKFGVEITIETPELDTPPQNENADKEGLGQALTDGDLMEKASKGEQ